MIGLKNAVRKAQLRHLRQWTRAHPAEARAESEEVSAMLFDYIIDRHARARRQMPPPRGPLFLCMYLPLYYEVDLRPLMRKLWAWQREQRTCESGTHEAVSLANSSCSHRDVCVMVPVVLDAAAAERAGLLLPSCRPPEAPLADTHSARQHDSDACASSLPSVPGAHVHAGCDDYDRAIFDHAMVFVEVRDDADLEASFEESGKYKILELKRSVFHQFFRRPEHMDTTDDATGTPPRRILLCDTWESLFPMFRRPRGVVQWEGSHATGPVCEQDGHTTLGPQSGSQLVVLAPGVRFDAISGARLGKGGGYYDRFLSFHRAECIRGGLRGDATVPERVATPTRTSPHATPAVDKASAASTMPDALVHIVGVGFRCQRADGASPNMVTLEAIAGEPDVTRLPVPADPVTDVRVDVVATPDGCTVIRTS